MLRTSSSRSRSAAAGLAGGLHQPRSTKNERTAFWPNIVGIFGAAALGEVVGLLGSVALGNSSPTIWIAQVDGVTVQVMRWVVAFANVTSMAVSFLPRSWACAMTQRHSRAALGRAVVPVCIVPLILVIFMTMYDERIIFLVWTSALNSALARDQHAGYFFLRRRLDLRALHGDPATSAYRFAGGFNPIGIVALVVGFVVYIAVFNPQTLEEARPRSNTSPPRCRRALRPGWCTMS